MKKTEIKIKQDDKNPIAQEVIASAIIQISKGMRMVNESRLSRKAIVALIADDTKLGKGLIETVLCSLDSMDTEWLKPVKK